MTLTKAHLIDRICVNISMKREQATQIVESLWSSSKRRSKRVKTSSLAVSGNFACWRSDEEGAGTLRPEMN